MTRELVWSYTVDGSTRAGHERYFVEGTIPFPVSPQGVRNHLGVPAVNLPDDEIELVEAYWTIQALAGSEELAAFEGDGPAASVIARGIEAQAALSVLPSMPLRVAEKESSGTDMFQRGDIDWAAIGVRLQEMVDAALTTVSGTDPTSVGSIFQLTQPVYRFGTEQ